MGWRDLLQAEGETIVAPWVGGSSITLASRRWRLVAPPADPGWYRFAVRGRDVSVEAPAEPDFDVFVTVRVGHLVGDRLVPDETVAHADPVSIATSGSRVHLLPPGLDRFARISAGRVVPDGRWFFKEEEFPLGPEDEVLTAWQDELPSTSHIRGVPPALDAAFRLERWRREEAARRRAELEAARRREELARTLGDGAGRRVIAAQDFEAAARAALAVGGARLLEHRASVNAGEMVVRFRLDDMRFECTCDARTLRIIDAGVCLVDHETDERGDTYFTLESLPGVIRQAEEEGVLVVFRHV